nr:unnamed protein product [uncultured bacterium]
MKVNYEFVPEFKSNEEKKKSDIISYAGKLLEIVGACTLIVCLDDDDRPCIYESSGRLVDALDFDIDVY